MAGGNHKDAWLAAIGLGGLAALTGGFGLLGAGGALGAGAGAGAAEAGAGAAAGGLAGADAVGAGAGTMGGLASAGLGGGAALGDSEMGLANAQYAGAHPFSALSAGIKGGVTNLLGGQDNYDAASQALSRFGKASSAVQGMGGLLGQASPGMPMPMAPRPMGQPQQGSLGVPTLAQTYGQPMMDPQTLQRLLMQQQFGGGYG